MTARKVAVVTGSNKGIGFAIVKGLLEKFNGDVYLTSRDVGRGQEAVEKLKSSGLNPIFHQLDITDENSVAKLKDYLKTKYDGLDLLVNNAAVIYPADSTVPLPIQAKETIRVNYFATLKVCEILFPILRPNARVINLSSSLGHLSQIKSEELKAKFNDKELTISELSSLMEKFVKDVEQEKYEELGWTVSSELVAYIVSKVGLSALTQIQQRLFDAETPNRNISINSVYPGYVDTDASQHKGILTPDEGAKAPLFLALEANLKGKFVWRDSSVIDWDATTLAEPY